MHACIRANLSGLVSEGCVEVEIFIREYIGPYNDDMHFLSVQVLGYFDGLIITSDSAYLFLFKTYFT